MSRLKVMSSTKLLLICTFLPVIVFGNKCPRPEDIMPCRCRGRNDQVQVWCSHSDLDRVNGALENLMRIRSMPVIDELIVENNKMPSLPARAFGALQISRLLLRNNGLKSLSRNAFAGLEDSLEELYIVEDQLSDLPFDAIERLRNLEAFTIEKSQIRLLPRFNGMNKLKHIRIDGGQITGFPVGAFAQMASIKQIHVVNANVASLAEGIFGPLDTLLLANFSGNHIGYVQRTSFALLPRLEILSLGNNGIEDAVAVGRAVEKLTSLKSLDLSHNRFKYIPEGSFVNLRTLQMLNLSGNKISSVQTRSFTHLPALRKVDLSDNQLQSFPKLMFDASPLLQELKLRRNLLASSTEIRTILDSLRSLRFLDLGENGFTEIPTRAIYNHTQLQKLDLSDNRVQRIQNEAFLNMPSLKEMSLRNNSLQEFSHPGQIPSLKELDLSINKLTQLSSSVLMALPSLTRVDLSHNAISQLTPNVFTGNKQLHMIDLAYNGLQSVPSHSFGGLTNLQLLDLSRNQIESLPSDVFHDLRRLRALNVANNRISNLPNDLLMGLKALQHLNMKANAINFIPERFFGYTVQLVDLNMRSNLISELGSNVFSNLNALESLALASNQIGFFDSTAFDGMPKLRALDLSYNRISNIPPHSFKNLVSLEKFEARENRIESVHDTAFFNSKKLQIIDLAHNKIATVPALIKRSVLLKVVDLSYNDIVGVSHEDFKKITGLVELYLNDNSITRLASKAFENLSSLTILDLDGNELDEIDKETFKNLPRLIYLRLSRNRIRKIRSYAFSKLTVLDGLDLQQNHLTDIADFAFDQTAALKYLNLSHNDFYSMDKMGLSSLPALEVLDVGYNRVREIDDKGFRNLKWLVELRINDNGICGFPSGVFDEMSRLKMIVMKNNFISNILESSFYKIRNNIAYLDLSGNPLNCDCKITWLRNLIGRETFKEISESTCQKPDELKGLKLKQIPQSKLSCSNGYGLARENNKCPVLTESKKKPRAEKVRVTEKPFFADVDASDTFRSKSSDKNERKSANYIESDDFIAGDTPTIYAGSVTTETKTKPNDYQSSKKGFGRISSIFGIPLDLGFDIGFNPSVYLDKKDPQSSPYLTQKSEGSKASTVLPSNWLARPSKQAVPDGSVYEPPEYIPRKPIQPYIPLNPDQTNVVPSGSTDIHKRVKPDSQPKSGIEFPQSGAPKPPPPPQSWHPAYPNAETGFIPIEPFFHHTGSDKRANDNKIRPTTNPTRPSTPVVTTFDRIGSTRSPAREPIEKTLMSPHSIKSTTLRPYGKNIFSDKGNIPVEYNILPPDEDSYGSSYSVSGEYEEYDNNNPSFRPVTIQTGDATDGRAPVLNKPQKNDFNLSNFWNLFGGDSKNKSRVETPSKTTTIIPVDFSNPVDASSIFPHERGKVPTGVQFQEGFAPSGPSGFSRRPPGKSTITKVTMEERPNTAAAAGPTSSSLSTYEDDSYGSSEIDNSDSSHPPIPPVLIGQPSEPLDWYYTNYNNTLENPPLDVMDRLIERSKFSGTIEEELRSIRSDAQCLHCRMSGSRQFVKMVVLFLCSLSPFLLV